MATQRHGHGFALQRVTSSILLLAVAVGGVLALLFFVKELLKPGELGSLSLPVVAFLAGVAATFNPCGLPALPGFLTFVGGGEKELTAPRRAGLSLATSLGAMSVIIVVGIIVALVGAGAKGLIAPYFRWVQLGVGLFLIGIATLHLMGQTSRLPLLGPVMALGSRMWEGAIGKPTPRSCYLFGGGFVAVGVG